MASSPVTSLQVLQASRIAAAAAAARQHAFYSRTLGVSRQAGDDRCLSTDPVRTGAFYPVSVPFHPYEGRL